MMRAYFGSVLCTVLLLPCGPLLAAGDAPQSKKGLVYYPMTLRYGQKEDKGGILVNVVNRGSDTFLLQGTVRAFDPATGRADEEAKSLPPFVILPPLERLEGEGRAALRVRQVGGSLPADRESAAIVSVQSIPAISSEVDDKEKNTSEDSNKNGRDNSNKAQSAGKGHQQLVLSLRMNLRLFWRPDGVPAPDMKTLWSQLKFQGKGSQLSVSNPTPYYLHFTKLKVAGSDAGALDAWLPPKGSQQYSFSQAVKGAVVWKLNGDENEHSTTL